MEFRLWSSPIRLPLVAAGVLLFVLGTGVSLAAPPSANRDAWKPQGELEGKLREIQVFTELQLGLVFNRLDCQYQRCEPRSLFAHEIFGATAEYRRVEKLPPECAAEPGAMARLGGRLLELACNFQNRTYVTRDALDKLDPIDQALLLILKRLDVFAPYEPFETKLALIQGLRLLHQRLTQRKPDESFRENFFSGSEVTLLERIPQAMASLCQSDLRPWQVLPSGAILIGKNRIEGRAIRLGAGAILHNTSVRGENILILNSRLTGFVEGKNIEIRGSTLFDSVHGENLVLIDTIVAPENRFAVLPQFEWRNRSVRVKATDSRIERTTLLDSSIRGQDLRIADSSLVSTLLEGDHVSALHSQFKAKESLPKAEEGSRLVNADYPFLVWLSSTGQSDLQRWLKEDANVAPLYRDLDVLWWMETLSGETNALDRNALLRPFPDPNRTHYLEGEFRSRSPAPLLIRGDSRTFRNAVIQEAP